MHFHRSLWSRVARGLIVAASMTLLVSAISSAITGCSEDPGPQAGVISTGNAGRLRGTVLGGSDSSSAIEGAQVVLEKLVGGTWSGAGASNADTSGGFAFRELVPGTYRVTARDAVGNSGTSSPFEVASDREVLVVVVIVPVAQVRLAFLLPDGEIIRGVEMEGSGLRGRAVGDSWILETRPGVAGVVEVAIEKAGSSRVVRYSLTWVSGDPVLSILDPGAPEVVPHLADSAVLLADWDFAGTDGALKDLSGRGNNGIAHGGVSKAPGSTAWSFDGTSGYVSLGDCIQRSPGVCADWTDGDLSIQIVLKLDSQTVAPVGHVVTLRSGNGEIMVKRLPGDTLGIGTASPTGFAGIGLPWAIHRGKWVDLAIVRDSTTDMVAVYLDGERVGGFLASSPLHSDEGIPPTLGAYSSGGYRYFAQMQLDRMRIWAGKFDSAQVRALHRSL